MRLPYEHPPRSIGFYLKYLGFLGFILLPVFVVPLIWLSHVPINALIIATALILLWRVISLWKLTLKIFVTDYDYNIDKGWDVSAKNLPVPESLEQYAQKIEMLGFIRMGEIQAVTAFDPTPVTEWLFTTDAGDITVEMLEFKGNVMLRFSSWFEDNRLIETAYPFGDFIQDENYRSAGIETSLEDAYHFHLRQMAAFESMYSSPKKILSVDEHMAFGKINKITHFKKRLGHPIQRFLISRFAESTGFSVMMCLLTWLLAENSFGTAYHSDTMATFPLIASVLLAILAGLGKSVHKMPSQNMRQAKKKSA